MFDLGWTEFLVIGIVALIVIGPKDLPLLFRKAGRFVGKARGMAREFSRAMDDAADQTGINEVSKTLKAASNPLKSSMDQVKQATSEFVSFDPSTETGKLAAERADAAKKIQEGAKKRAKEKLENKNNTEQAKKAKKLKADQKANPQDLITKKKAPLSTASRQKDTSDDVASQDKK